MSKEIEKGERVVIRMASTNVLPWGIRFEATYVHGPQGEGDVFEFDAPDGTRFCLNGNSHEFVGLWRAAPTPESQEEGGP